MAKTKKRTALVLALALSIGITQIGRSRAYSTGNFPQQERTLEDDKLSSDLLDRIGSARLSDPNLSDLNQAGEERVRVILQLKRKHHRAVDPLLADEGISTGDELKSLNSRIVEVPLKKLRGIAASDDVA
jgi:hypothetical protein